MFRRKGEDNLFDTIESAEGQTTVESVQSTSPQSAAPLSVNATSVHAATPATTAAAAPAAPQARPAVEQRPVQTANAFRPSSAAPASDLTRNRLPETKNATQAPAAATSFDKSNKSGKRVLTVGNDILLKGEIATCDRLVIEGKVDATLNDVHTVEIAEFGSFKGSAIIEDAEISGLFEGDLVVRNCLVIRSTGKVRGKITYGEIEIERGGELSGEIKSGTSQSSANRPAASRPAVKQDDKVAA